MHRLFIASILWFTLTLGAALAAPARPLYVPPDPPKRPAPVIFSVSGTAWLGKYLTINRTFIFEANGSVSYKSTTPTIFKMRGAWRLEGNRLIFEHTVGKNKVMDFVGILKDNNTIVGEATYKAGNKATMTLQRTVMPGK